MCSMRICYDRIMKNVESAHLEVPSQFAQPPLLLQTLILKFKIFDSTLSKIPDATSRQEDFTIGRLY